MQIVIYFNNSLIKDFIFIDMTSSMIYSLVKQDLYPLLVPFIQKF